MKYRTILLIDDDDEDQEIFTTALDQVTSSITCMTRSNARIALEELESNAIAPDLIFIDLNMPEMNGQQFLLEISRKNHLSEIPVIVLTTSSHPSTIMLVKELGARDFITKPNNFDELLKILDNILVRD